MVRHWMMFFASVAFAWPAATLASDQPARIKVGLAVQFDNKEVEAEATSFLSRELRGLGDVDLVTSGADVIIDSLGAGDDTIALSTVVERPYHGDWFQKFGLEITLSRAKILKDGQEIPDETWKLAKRFVGESDILGHWINLTTRHSLKEACVGLIAHIDAEALAKERERVAEIKSSRPKVEVPPK